MTVLALLLAFGATARLTRLLTTDDFPPTAWLRTKSFARALRLARRHYDIGDDEFLKSSASRGICTDRARRESLYKLLTCPTLSLT